MVDRGHKSVLLNRQEWSALIGFAGVARTRTVDVSSWLGSLTLGIHPEAKYDDLLDRLLTADEWLHSIGAEYRAHTFSVLAYVLGRPVFSLVTNIDRLDGPRDATAADRLRIQTMKLRRTKLFLTGVTSPVGRPTRRAIERAGATEPDVMSRHIAELNAAVSQILGGRLVSDSCVVSYIEPTGRGVTMPFGIKEDSRSFVPPDLQATLRSQGIELRPRTDAAGNPMPIHLLQMVTQVTPDGTQSLMEFQASIDEINTNEWQRLPTGTSDASAHALVADKTDKRWPLPGRDRR